MEVTFVFHSFPGDEWDIGMLVTIKNSGDIPRGTTKGAQKMLSGSKDI